MATFLNAASMISEGVELENLPSTLTGSFRVAASTSNDAAGSEAGTIEYDIAEPIRIISSNEDGTTDISLAAGNIFTVSADAATGQGSLSFDVGALAILAPTDDGLARVSLDGYTGSAEINPQNGELVVSDLGFSNGPLSFSLDNTEVLRMTLETFGFRATEGTDLEPGEVIIDGDMDLSVIANQFGDFGAGSDLIAATLDVMIPSNTSVSRAGNGATRIGGVGPLTVSFSGTNGDNVVSTDTAIVDSGECFIELEPDTDPGAASFAMCE